jgi:hypothetical protein
MWDSDVNWALLRRWSGVICVGNCTWILPPPLLRTMYTGNLRPLERSRQNPSIFGHRKGWQSHTSRMSGAPGCLRRSRSFYGNSFMVGFPCS